jgi:hypothetical protein
LAFFSNTQKPCPTSKLPDSKQIGYFNDGNTDLTTEDEKIKEKDGKINYEKILENLG